MIGIKNKSKFENEYFVLVNTRDNGIESAYLTMSEVVRKTYDLCEYRYVYTVNAQSSLRQILDIILLSENNEPVSLTSLVEKTDTYEEFEEEVNRLLEMAEAK
ncbi:MAG: hypothetical protein ABF651_00025 [Sporolactobacillus sp.]